LEQEPGSPTSETASTELSPDERTKLDGYYLGSEFVCLCDWAEDMNCCISDMRTLAARLLMNSISFPLYFINPMLVSEKLE